MIELSSEIWADMVAEAIATYPMEGCGILLGAERYDRIDRFVPIRNANASPTEYTLDPIQYVEATTLADEDGLDVVGIMHSHPAGRAVPSLVDINRAGHPLIPTSWHWVIVGLASSHPDVRSYTIQNGQAQAESIRVSD